MKQTIRIIGGLFRGKKLHFPSIDGLRPTPDRIRETLFNWLMHDIRNARCLDAFAGSGALGFEAYSRQAAKIVFIEYAQEAYVNLKKTALSFNSTNMIIKQTNACDYLKNTTEEFDIVFLDPPFAKQYLPDCIQALAHNDVLIPGGLLYVESPQALQLDETTWECLKLKHAGQIVYALYKKIKTIALTSPHAPVSINDNTHGLPKHIIDDK